MIKDSIRKKSASRRKNEKGVILYIALITASSLIVASAIISSIMIGEFKISGDIKNSLDAVNAAGSGLESVLYQSRKDTTSPIYTSSQNNTTQSFPGVLCSSLSGLDSVSIASGSDCSVDTQTGYIDSTNPLCVGIASSGYDCTKVDSTGTSGGFNRRLEGLYQER